MSSLSGGQESSSDLDIRQVVTDHYRAVYRYAFRLTGNADDAEDVTQQTFLLAQDRLHQVRDRERVDRWLFAVLRSCYLKSRRRRRPTSAANLELDVDQIADGRVREDTVDREKLQSALNDLPDQFKLILVMFYFEQLSYREISERLEIPLGTVMSRLSRAKGRLRHRLLAPRAAKHGTAGRPS